MRFPDVVIDILAYFRRGKLNIYCMPFPCAMHFVPQKSVWVQGPQVDRVVNGPPNTFHRRPAHFWRSKRASLIMRSCTYKRLRPTGFDPTAQRRPRTTTIVTMRFNDGFWALKAGVKAILRLAGCRPQCKGQCVPLTGRNRPHPTSRRYLEGARARRHCTFPH